MVCRYCYRLATTYIIITNMYISSIKLGQTKKYHYLCIELTLLTNEIMKNLIDKINWCITQHSDTNHYYDTYLPYEFHIRMAAKISDDFAYLLPKEMRIPVKLACWGHDIIEDCRISYNDVKKVLGEMVADMIYAVTNDKGKTRKERAGEKYYKGIRNTPFATFVKLCDRIANLQYSKMTKSTMFKMYQKENDYFMDQLGLMKDGKVDASHSLSDMADYLIELLNEKL